MAGVWELVPGRSATEALCLLAMHHLEAGARRAARRGTPKTWAMRGAGG